MTKTDCKNLLFIITGSIAAYKSLDLIRLLKKNDYNITPIMTKAATKFVTPFLVSTLCGKAVMDKLFSAEDESKIGHINLSRQNDLIVIAPATANFIAKMAGGLATDLASSVILAADKQIIIAPAMNEKMWLHPQTQKNLQILREFGVIILNPITDMLACGEYGLGKMVLVEEIFKEIDKFFNQKKTFAGKKIIITAGATFEPIDPVRFIGNYSSGKQGIAIALHLDDLGADVLLVAANVNEAINLPAKNLIRVKTANQMLLAVEQNLSQTDVFISAAAVADFKPKNVAKNKIKKSSENCPKSIELVENVDILKTIGYHQSRPKIVVGFAAESENLLINAREKLKAKNCDIMVANNVNDGEVFGSNYNQITIIDNFKRLEEYSKMTKSEVAEKLAEVLAQLILTNQKL